MFQYTKVTNNANTSLALLVIKSQWHLQLNQVFSHTRCKKYNTTYIKPFQWSFSTGLAGLANVMVCRLLGRLCRSTQHDKYLSTHRQHKYRIITREMALDRLSTRTVTMPDDAAVSSTVWINSSNISRAPSAVSSTALCAWLAYSCR